MKITHQSNLSIRICNNDNRVLVQELLFQVQKANAMDSTAIVSSSRQGWQVAQMSVENIHPDQI